MFEDLGFQFFLIKRRVISDISRLLKSVFYSTMCLSIYFKIEINIQDLGMRVKEASCENEWA